MTFAVTDVRPGDWFVVDPGSWASPWIRLGERIVDAGRPSPFAHAGIASRWEHGKLMIVQAEPAGAQEVEWMWGARPHKWSTGTRCSGGPAAAAAAITYSLPGPWGKHGVPYGWTTYGAVALHHFGIDAAWLRASIESAHSMYCSQLVDRCCMDAGVQLFDDGRWPGYVPPSDLGFLLERQPLLGGGKSRAR